MFELSIKWGYRADNPAKGVGKFHEEKRHRWLSDDELARLIAALADHPNQRAANVIRLQLLTGARIGEVLSARWSDFDLARGVWTKPSHHTKQKRTEHLPLSGAAVSLLVRLASTEDAPRDLIFPGSSANKPMVDLRRFWSAVLSAARIENYRIHDNRHTHASHLVSSGMSLAVVGRLLGHTNPMTTQRYAHLADDPLREAADLFGRKIGI
jgi:integrase